MNNFLLPAAIVLSFSLSFLCALVGCSLRDFSRSRLDEICRKNGRAARFGVILKRHDDAILTLELFFLISIVVSVILVAEEFAMSLPASSEPADWAYFLAKLLLLFVVTVAISVPIPWTISRVAGEHILFKFWPVIRSGLTITKPFLSLTWQIDKFTHRLSGLKEPGNGDAAVLTDEIRTVVDEGQREGIIESEARTMIHRVMELQKEDAAAIMTPRTDMVCIPATATLEEARTRLLEAGHSRVPIIGETTDDIIGILYAKDLLRHLNSADELAARLTDIVREPFYVPETTHIDTLLETMKRKRVHLAIVIDEYSGIAGLVTMEDILEEIVGEIVDEYDAAEETGIQPISPGIIEVQARVHVDDLNEQFEFDLPEDGDFDTVGGFVFMELGRIPVANETFAWRQLRFTVLSADKRQIHKLRIEVDKTLAVAHTDEQS